MIRRRHTKARGLFMSIATILLSAAFVASGAQSRVTRPASVAPVLTPQAGLPLTCAQAWAAAHRDYSRMLSVIVTLARVSLANRDLTFPKSRESGVDAGKGIAEDCKADPDALLFAIVDKHVRRVAGSPG